MPMIDVTLPEGALTEDAKSELVERLTATLIAAEGAPDNEYIRAITWCFVDERPAGSINVGGSAARRPVYRVVLTVPEGAPTLHGPLMLTNREKLVRQITEHVLEAEGTPYSDAEAGRVWVQMREIREGYWGGFGAIARMEDIATYAGLAPNGQPTERGERARAAFEASRDTANAAA
jgi:phenylpyruvate tautomerase PptA (4-oxalocrotonate tautomerase family)